MISPTGRLRNSEPNMQNIPIRTEIGRQIREAFLGSHGAIASVERVAQHRNGTAAPFVSVLFTTTSGRKMHAVVFDTPGVLSVFNIEQPQERYEGNAFEPELRAALEEVGLPIEHDPLGALHNRVSQLLTLVRQRRSETPAGPDHGRAKLRAIGRHLDTAKHAIARAMERAAQ